VSVIEKLNIGSSSSSKVEISSDESDDDACMIVQVIMALITFDV
jgi:hypothetical protein